MAAATQPIAVQCALNILRSGGNAADAGIALAAGLCVLEPCSTGLGGDAFALFYSAKDKRVYGLNGSGRSARHVNVSAFECLEEQDRCLHASQVTVPGAAAAWIDCVEKWGSGKVQMGEILREAIELAEDGAPIAPITAKLWNKEFDKLSRSEGGNHFLVWDQETKEYRGPKAGERFTNKELANVFKTLVKEGKDGFYKGWIAQDIVDTVQRNGGYLTMEDLALHESDFVDPISINYNGIDVYEIV
jgi:gamma-glutamyltranspeptidase/glutathione hydrolase